MQKQHIHAQPHLPCPGVQHLVASALWNETRNSKSPGITKNKLPGPHRKAHALCLLEGIPSVPSLKDQDSCPRHGSNVPAHLIPYALRVPGRTLGGVRRLLEAKTLTPQEKTSGSQEMKTLESK